MNVPKHFWVDVVSTTCFLINKKPSYVLNWATPYHQLFQIICCSLLIPRYLDARALLGMSVLKSLNLIQRVYLCGIFSCSTTVLELITNAWKIINFIYNHGCLLTKMRKVYGGDIVRLGATRFATNYIALESLLKNRADLKKIFISNEWASHKLSRSTIGHEVEVFMFDHTY